MLRLLRPVRRVVAAELLTVATFSRKGLHRLECPMCEATVYSTVAQLEQRGLPACWCGERFQPATVDLALHLGADDAPIAREFFDREARKDLAQKPAQIRASRRGRDPSTLNDMTAAALDEVRELQRSNARKRRLALFTPTPEVIPF